GIIWAADHDADVINLSLGGIGFAHDTVLADAISYAFNKGVVIVAAAGNDVAVTGGNLDKDPVFPICDDNGENMIIGVTATDVNDLKPSFANFGKACVDVSAPGKRILSTINHDPASGTPAPDAYAYASGTSLAVPFVSAEAALLRSLFPRATNKQIRDRIISSSDNIDSLNLSQCAGSTCKGLLGGGRINAAKSLENQIVEIKDGDVVQVKGSTDYYLINGGKRQLISPFVFKQRFANVTVKNITASDLAGFAEGSYAVPLDGTLVKSPNDPAVYYIQSGLRRPLTYQVFTMRQFKFTDVITLTNVEVGSWIEGSFLAPPDGSLVRSPSNPTVYWVVNGTLHPINYKFYIDRGLKIFPVVYAPENDISKFPHGDSLVL
ncbi:MAG TPA: S8 family serine peptidase, partial [Patescibacteria group bacterium]|nr:S8 family serine peptidase [Patescibacteria group bacterium]